MSTTTDTAPAAETEIAENIPLTEALTGDRHERSKEVGEDDALAALAETAPAAPAAAPAAATAKPEPAPTPAVDPAAKPEAEQPFWYRQEAKKLRQRAEAAERELAARPRPEAPRQPTGEPEDPDRPLTRRELEVYQERAALIGRLERSEESFIDKHGEDTFEATREWLATRPDIEEWALKQRSPWKAAHSQFQKEKLASEIGEDPNAWRDAERERIRQEILAEQDAGGARAAPQAAPQMRSAPPAPASTARAAAPRDPGGRFTGPAPLAGTFKHRG